MAKVSIIENHDYMRFTVTFTEGVKLTGNFGRGGYEVKLAPYSSDLARKVSGLFAQEEIARGAGKWNLRETFKNVDAAGKAANTIDEFVFEFKSRMKSDQGFEAADLLFGVPREKTLVNSAKKGRGWNTSVKFKNGDVFSMTINGRSISYNMQPMITALVSEMGSLAMGVIMTGSTPPQELGELLAKTAEDAESVEVWIENTREALTPSYKLGR